ncbi:MAG: 16S rRNA (guanine(527)-N(7))-methyltransferase RsmG [Candidatus Izemoplasmatales bacterium]|jgi:16S rRNA (guanine527-N7)-methyltransferase|nr:16S rRNA (guanine(527)-N(7))-methyltransferase RsmG [Candidatus Izemoplasmatales bacterium]
MEPTILKFDQTLWDMLKDPSFSLYFRELIAKNEVMNLTNITDETDVYEKHFYDSIILKKVFDLKDKNLLDIGAGAGFPSLPLKLVEPKLNVFVVDSLNKRIEFLRTMRNLLAIDNYELKHQRAEEMDKNELYDLVTARAVARLNILSELSLPYVKLNGYFIAYKSINYQEELIEAKNAINTLGGKLEKIIIYEVNSDLKHALLIIKKIKTTPDIYPRVFAKIKKSPL